MSHKVGKIRNLRVIKALRGESLSIDLGRGWNGVVTAWMKKNPNSETYRSFEVLDNRYLILSKEKTSDYYNGENLIESIEGKWYFDVELIEDGSTIEQSQTIYTGTIYFENDITGSNGVEILDYDNGLPLKTVENTNSINLTKEESNLKADLNISDNQGEGVTVTIEEDGLKVNIDYPDIPTSLSDLGYTGETNATADQTSSEIIELYESDSDINRYSNFQKNKNGLYLTDFECKPDLKYIDIEFNSVNQIICPLDTFTDADVGKLIAIKDTHHNPNMADGTEYPNSQLGRIVTVTTKITAVNNGVATIDFSCNLTANARAYSYTNNFDALQDAINYAQENKIETIVRDSEGIYGINPLFSEKYTDAPALVIPNTWHLTIKGVDENPFKFCLEDTITVKNWFVLKQGNYDFTLDGKILPPDRISTSFGLSSTVVNTNWNNEYAGDSVRSITLKNIGRVDENDTDGNDSWFCELISNSRGGANNTDKKQILTLENVDVRLLYGGFSSFSQNGNFNTLYHKDWNWKRWGNHYLGEVGKEFATTFEELNTDEMESWTFNSRDNDNNIIGQTLNFTVNSGVLTMDDLSSNFSFYDYRTASILGALRTVYVVVDNVNYEITNVINAKSIEVSGLPDGNYTDEWNVKTGYGSYGHPIYHHPNQEIYFENCVGDVDEVKLSTGGGVPNETNNIICFSNCDINYVRVDDNGERRANIEFYNSVINQLSLSVNKIKVKGSSIRLGGATNYIESLGANHFLSSINYLAGGFLVKEENDFYSYDDILDFSYLDFEKESRVTFDNWSISEDGIGRVGFYEENSIVTYKNSKRNTAFSFESIGRHSNFYAYYINNKITEPLYRSVSLFNYTFHPSTITDRVFFQDSLISFNNGRYNLDPSQTTYLALEPMNKIDVSTIYNLKGKYDSIVTQQHKYTDNNFGFPATIFNIDIALNFNLSNYFKLNSTTDERFIPRGLAVAPMNNRADIFSRGTGLGSLSNLSLFKGLVYIEITNTNQLKVLDSKLHHFGQRNVTNNNILVKTLERKVGEVITFEILPNCFLREIDSTNKQKNYVDSIPLRKGINGEKFWLNSDVSYVYEIQTNVLNDEVLTVSITEETPFVHTLSTSDVYNQNAYVIDTGKVFTIGQNFSDGNITPFSFKIVLDDNTELSFDNVGLHNNPDENTEELPNLVRSAWLYKANDGVSTYCAYVDNLSGKIVILKNNDITLKATDNLIINGLEVVSENWYRNYEKQGIELLTTTERNAILSECREGYEVYDNELNQRFIKINNNWI